MKASLLWRASLLALGCEAPPKKLATATQSSGSKLPRHNKLAPTGERSVLSLVQCGPHESRSALACRAHQWPS
ncbi:hypothetical protein DD985_11445 [Pseudomonas sp. HMWF011]|nr:hypothetical protein C2U56_21600 [Pseudomonas fluorescens]PTT08396.1 hypothetical protein DBR14_21620 [Pseudomonas sp. HMWF034]PVV72237.1 hypothetical protein DD985_11445 [Pseudomonas sp. HMWF011]